jgi:hypothetical protein
MGHGKSLSSGCICDKSTPRTIVFHVVDKKDDTFRIKYLSQLILGYWGPRCQFEDECTSDSDCGKGTCVDLGGTSLPQKQCFCPPGLHGEKCKMQNKAQLANQNNLDVSKHKMKELSSKIKLYHKVTSDLTRKITFQHTVIPCMSENTNKCQFL